MIAIYLLLFIISVFLIAKFEKTPFSPLTIMAICWCLFPAYASIGAGKLGIYEFGWITHVCIVSAYIVFVLGYFVFEKVRFNVQTSNSNNCKSRQNNKYDFNINYIFLIAANIFIFFYLLPHLQVSIKYIIQHGFSYLRAYAELLFSTSTVDNLIYIMFVRPFIIASCSVVGVDLFHNKRSFAKFVALFVVIINVVSDALIFAGRATLVKLILYFFFSLFFIKNKNIKKRTIIIFALVAVLLLLVVITITGDRMSDTGYSDYNIIDNLSMYYVAPFGLLNYYIYNTDFSLINVQNTWGASSFGFVYNLFKYAEALLFNVDYSGTDHLLTSITQYSIQVGSTVRINSACTAAYIFLRDFGFFGLIAGFFSFGCLTSFIKKVSHQKNSSTSKAIYVFFLYCIFRLSMSYDFLSPSTFFVIIYIILLTTRLSNSLYLKNNRGFFYVSSSFDQK